MKTLMGLWLTLSMALLAQDTSAGESCGVRLLIHPQFAQHLPSDIERDFAEALRPKGYELDAEGDILLRLYLQPVHRRNETYHMTTLEMRSLNSAAILGQVALDPSLLRRIFASSTIPRALTQKALRKLVREIPECP